MGSARQELMGAHITAQRTWAVVSEPLSFPGVSARIQQSTVIPPTTARFQLLGIRMVSESEATDGSGHQLPSRGYLVTGHLSVWMPGRSPWGEPTPGLRGWPDAWTAFHSLTSQS